MTHDELVASPEAKKIAREIAERPWASKMLIVSDPVLRRLGSMLVLQEVKERLGLIPRQRPERPEAALAQETNRAREAPEDEAPDTLRSPPPAFDLEPPPTGAALACKGCGATKAEECFYRSTSSRTGRQALCKPCFNRKYGRRKA